MKTHDRWYSDRLERHVSLARWGTYGAPVLVFPTAGGDAEEVERHHLVEACGTLLADGRIKLYSVDSVAGQVMMSETGSPESRLRMLNRFQDCIHKEIVPAIRADCGGEDIPVIAAGASIGAFNSLAVLCRYPDAFRAAVCMSGSYDVQRFYEGAFTQDLYYCSPLHFLPDLDGPQLDLLRQRFAVIASGQGAWENIDESWRVGNLLGSKSVPNRVDVWGTEWDHEWPTWWSMLPQYLDELT